VNYVTFFNNYETYFRATFLTFAVLSPYLCYQYETIEQVSIFCIMNRDVIASNTPTPLNILLADDDADDRHFFDLILKKIPIPTRLATVEDGEKLMTYLSYHLKNLPDVLFLDLNMPRKNGLECLSEIKDDKKLKDLPVVIYSTHKHEKDAKLLYNQGAHYYIQKTDMIELTKALHYVLNQLVINKFTRPTKDKFIHLLDKV